MGVGGSVKMFNDDQTYRIEMVIPFSYSVRPEDAEVSVTTYDYNLKDGPQFQFVRARLKWGQMSLQDKLAFIGSLLAQPGKPKITYFYSIRTSAGKIHFIQWPHDS